MNSPASAPEFGFSEQLEVGREAMNYNRWIADQFMPYAGKRVLEVGCGIGNLSQYWTDREAFVGIDTEAECVAKTAQRFSAHSNVSILHDHVGAPDWVQRWSAHRPDTVVAVNVLEHIRDDLGALRGWRDIVRAGGGGHVCVFVPAFEFAYSSFDKRYGHYRRYTKSTLRDKLLDAGLDLEVLRYFNLPGLLAWWLTFVLLRRNDAVPGQVGLYDKVVVPLVRRIEEAITPPFGNSVVAVCRVAPP
jgi:SAM-dependent methyltransferase